MARTRTTQRRTLVGFVAALSLAGGLSAVAVRADPATTLTPSQTKVTWSQGPATAPSTVPLTIDVPDGYWSANPGGLTVRIDTGNPNAELDLFLADADGHNLAESRYGARTYQQIYLPAPPNGDYMVNVAGPKGTVGPAYAGTASLVSWPTPQAPTVPGDMQFARTTVDAQILANEPGIALDPGGRVYVDAPNGFNNTTSLLWRSDDGAKTFHVAGATTIAGIKDPRQRPCGASSGGGDIDVATDRTGRVYFADLEDFAVSVGYSTDHGKTWTCNALEGPVGDDRPWIAAAPTADGGGPAVDAYVAYIDLISGQIPAVAITDPQQIHVLATKDGGATWTALASFGAGLVPVPGPLFVGPTGNLYLVFSGLDAVWLAESTDEGKTFTLTKISQRLADPRGNGFGWTVGAVDTAGNLYATWVDGGTGDVLYTRSTDDGFSWSNPVRVNPPGQVGIRPWITAGQANDVAVAWYGAQGNFLPGPGAPDGTRWYAYVARNTDVADATSPFAVARMSPVPTMVGFGDNVDAGSVAQDFFKVVMGADGRLYAAFCDAGRLDVPSPYEVAGSVYAAALNAPPQPQPYIVVARQISGTGLSASASNAATAPAYVGPKPLRFLSEPVITSDGENFTVTFQLSGSKLSEALDATGLPATDAYWVVLLRTGSRQEYAVMRQSRQGGPTFAVAGQPTGGIYPSTDECCATYPGKTAVNGHVDPDSGTVTITGPLSALHLHAGQRIYYVQAFSMVGRPGSDTRYNLLDEADVTPASTQTL